MGATYSLDPTYYQVTVNFASPTDYTGLTNSASGAVDSVPAADYNRRISTTGNVNVAIAGVGAGNSLVINGQTITFGANTSSAVSIVNTINLYRKDTGVMAHQETKTNYITLCNAPTFDGTPFYIADGTTPVLAKLGLKAGTYTWGLTTIGSGFTAPSNADNVVVNGVTVAFGTSPGLDINNVVATFNSLSTLTGVTAAVAAGNIQLNAVDNVPFTIAGSNTIANKLGFNTGAYGGTPSTLANSTSKEQANMRWQLIVNALESLATPFKLGEVMVTGSYNGNTAPTSTTFTVSFERADQISTVEQTGEPNPGNVLNDIAAIKRSVARALVSSYTTNRKLFDPTLDTYRYGSGLTASRSNPFTITQLTASGIDILSNIATVEGNITVNRISDL